MEGNAVPDKNKDILIVTVNYPKLGEKTKTFWDKMFAEYFEAVLLLRELSNERKTIHTGYGGT